MERTKPRSHKEEMLDRIKKHVELDREATRPQRELEADDMRFTRPETQWDDDDRRAREGAGRPVLTEDRLGPFLQQVCNDQRKNKPGVQVNPVDDSGDKETAEVLQGLIRHIEYNSNADSAYDTAFESAVRCGRGFYRICTDYVDPNSFDQEIQIKRVVDINSVFIDPAAQECDLSDMRWGGFKQWYSREDYEDLFPDSDLSSAAMSDWAGLSYECPDWITRKGDACLVVEYYYKKEVPITLYELEDGTVITKKTDLRVIRERKSYEIKVYCVKCNAMEILEEAEFPSQYIPIISVLGKETVVDGQKIYAGLIRSAKDTQRRLNYLLTAQIERIAFMPLATWIGPKGFMGKNATLWNRAHTSQMAALEFEIIGEDGQGINRPQLITEEAPIRAVTEAMLGAEEGMKAVLGMWNPSQGRNESGQSGLAIGRLQQQAETGNFHFQDNLSRALRYEGRVLLDMIRRIYDSERVIRIIGSDEKQQTVKINGETDDQKLFDVTAGKYDVTISTGPSYQSRRQEDRALLLGLMGGPLGQLLTARAPDVVVSTLDSPIAKTLEERLTPPEFQKSKEGAEPNHQMVMTQMGQQLQAFAQQNEQLAAALQQAQDQLETKDAEMQLELAKAQMDSETRRYVADRQAETELIKAGAQTEAKKLDSILWADIESTKINQKHAIEVASLLKPEPVEDAGEESITKNAGDAAGEEE